MSRFIEINHISSRRPFYIQMLEICARAYPYHIHVINLHIPHLYARLSHYYQMMAYHMHPQDPFQWP